MHDTPMMLSGQFFKIWVPMIVGIWALIEHLEPFSPMKVQSMWRSFIFHSITMLFIAFPCSQYSPAHTLGTHSWFQLGIWGFLLDTSVWWLPS